MYNVLVFSHIAHLTAIRCMGGVKKLKPKKSSLRILGLVQKSIIPKSNGGPQSLPCPRP